MKQNQSTTYVTLGKKLSARQAARMTGYHRYLVKDLLQKMKKLEQGRRRVTQWVFITQRVKNREVTKLP